jgi:hypothetical protein
LTRETTFALLTAASSVMMASACRQDMHDQPRYEPLEASLLFRDGRASRPLVEGTVARGHLQLDKHLYTGKVGGKDATTFPFPITRDVLERGHQRFEIFCTPCHGRVGAADGMVVKRGFRQPTSLHIERLRQAPPGYFFGVMTQGFGAMYSYASRIDARDRWAIVAYIRALQLSQNATIDDVPDDKKDELLGGQP